METAQMPVCLVTGASGFLGRPLRDALLASEFARGRVVAVGRHRPSEWSSDDFIQADLTNLTSIRRAIEEAAPSVVFHLAGKTPPAPTSELYLANSVATALLLDVLRDRGQPVRVVLTGSAAELGPVEVEMLPVGEDFPCRPVTSYGLSKWLATCAGLAAPPPLEVMVARIFNPIGPGTPESQALGRFAVQFNDPAVETLSVGCLDTRRDFVDVRDVAQALLALARHGRPGLVYHVGTGVSQRVGDGLEQLQLLSGSRVRVTIDPVRAGSAGPGDSRADIRRIVDHTGWRPEIPWGQSIEDLWHEVRGRTPWVELT